MGRGDELDQIGTARLETATGMVDTVTANAQRSHADPFAPARPRFTYCRAPECQRPRNPSTHPYCDGCGNPLPQGSVGILSAADWRAILMLSRLVLPVLGLSLGALRMVWPVTLVITLLALSLVHRTLLAHPVAQRVAIAVGWPTALVAFLISAGGIPAGERWAGAIISIGLLVTVALSASVRWAIDQAAAHGGTGDRVLTNAVFTFAGSALVLIVPFTLIVRTVGGPEVEGVTPGSIASTVLVLARSDIGSTLLPAASLMVIGLVTTFALARGLRRQIPPAPFRARILAPPPGPRRRRPSAAPLSHLAAGMAYTGALFVHEARRVAFEVIRAWLLLLITLRRIWWDLRERSKAIAVEGAGAIVELATSTIRALLGPVRILLGTAVSAAVIVIFASAIADALAAYAHASEAPQLLVALASFLGVVLAVTVLVAAVTTRSLIEVLSGVAGVVNALLPSALILVLLTAWGLGLVGDRIPGNPYRVGPFTLLLTIVALVGVVIEIRKSSDATEALQEPVLNTPAARRPWHVLIAIAVVLGAGSALLIETAALRAADEAMAAASKRVAVARLEQEAAVQGWITRTVRSGDTLAAISAEVGVPAAQLALANRFHYPTIRDGLLVPGAALLIPRYDVRYEYLGQDQPQGPLAVGSIGRASVRLRNVGTTTWVRGTSTEVWLGAPDPTTLEVWRVASWPSSGRLARMSDDIVGPGSSALFTFEFRVPARGTALRFQPVVEGLAWLPDVGMYIPTVQAP